MIADASEDWPADETSLGDKRGVDGCSLRLPSHSVMLRLPAPLGGAPEDVTFPPVWRLVPVEDVEAIVHVVIRT